ncbi:hypothetical protein SOASR014_15960 [Pectobacterium carotovorum subsp. carotovorum]|nr:hypothetical protein SOASR014_15960 [Pectobacterium carotovorum subsp. carotovorum]GLX44661.1 hypothetical protein Pcaca01_23290 [Pectobacterium carotovorum subsp. carotovorum]
MNLALREVCFPFVIRCFCHHIDCPERTGDDAAFAADTAGLNNLNAIPIAHQRVIRTYAGTGRILALAA